MPAQARGSRGLSDAAVHVAALGFYLAAKVAESYDAPIYGLGGLVSGHTLKHLLAAMGAWWLLRMVRQRAPKSTEAIQAGWRPPVGRRLVKDT